MRQYDKRLEKSERARKGAYFTPKKLADEMHHYIQDLYPNYREEHLIWDCCCGTANLTRDYEFKDLILSTLDSAELDLVKKYKINDGALYVQHDFLNEYIPDEIDEKLRNTNKVLHFVINPPYGTGSVARKKGVSTKGMTQTRVRDEMKRRKINTSDITFQFMYRCVEIALFYKLPFVITLFSKTNYITGEQCDSFREYFYKNCEYQNGFIFKASHFADVSKAFPIICATWKQGKQLSYDIEFDFYGDAEDIPEDNFIEGNHTYQQWVDLCYIYSLIETKNNCTAMRKVLWKDQEHRVQNHFFFYTRQQARFLLNKYLLEDFNEDEHEPMYASALLEKDLTHPLLDKVRALWVKSLKDREKWHIEHSEHHVNAWDAGIYQLKYMWKELYTDDWNEIYDEFVQLRESLRYGVYKWGFLKKLY